MLVGDALDPVVPIASTFTLMQTVQLLASTLNYTRQRGPDSANVTNGSTFDFIIVGGGTAGLVLANRLTEVEEWKVLVVEAGDDPSLVSGIPGLFPFLIRSPEDWGFQNIFEPEYAHGLNNNTSYLPAGKCLGGSSSIQDLLHERGNPEDYNEWADLGNPGWDWESCRYYFKKPEGVVDPNILKRPTAPNHCTNGPWNIQAQKVNSQFEEINSILLNAFKDIGFPILSDLIQLPQNGTAKPDFTITEERLRASTYFCYLLSILDRLNLFVLKNAFVTQIIIEDNIAVGVKVARDSGEVIIINANIEVIISAGVYNTPKLLQLSGIGPRKHLEELNITVKADLPVGSNLKDHVFVPLVITGNDNVLTAAETVLSVIDLTSFPLPIVCGAFYLSGEGTVPDIQHITSAGGAASPLFLYLFNVKFNYNLKVTLSFINATKDRQLIFSLVQLMKPNSTGFVKIRSTDPYDDPIISHNYLKTGDDLMKLTAGLKKMAELRNAPYFSRTDSKVVTPDLDECREFEKGTDEYWVCYVKQLASTTYHAVGTCKMAPLSNGGVVDSSLRVYHTSHLRVVDASIMPTQPCSKTCTPVVMVAEKAADIIKLDYGKTVEEFVCSQTLV